MLLYVLVLLVPSHSVYGRTLFGCEGSLVNISCAYGHHISIVRANYGRFSVSVCNPHAMEWGVSCGTEDRSTDRLREE